jgi:hypothetical protein
MLVSRTIRRGRRGAIVIAYSRENRSQSGRSKFLAPNSLCRQGFRLRRGREARFEVGVEWRGWTVRLSDGKCWEKDGSWLNLWANLSTEIIIFFLTLFELIWLCSTSICKNQGNPTKSRMKTLPAVLSIYVHSQPVVPIRRIEGATDRTKPN